MQRTIAVSAATALVAGLVVAAGATPAQAAEPPVLPTPQSIAYTGTAVALDGNVVVVADADVDAPAKRELTEALAEAGATATWQTTTPASGTVIHFSVTDAETQALATQLGVASAADLNDEGYVVANGTVSGRPTVLLEGKTDIGLFYAVDTFEQLIVDGTMAAARVRDWPLMPIRGSIEGFYGIPWSHEARLDQLDFYGEHKMNTYIYTPKDDPYLRAQWRNPYPEAELDKIAELVQRAKDNHVEFVFALSPGNDICYSRQADFDATIAKFEQVRAVGVTTFYIALDDIDPYLKCAEDLAQFTLPGFRKLAEGQAYYLNKVINEFIKPNNLEPLQTVPTNYAGSAPDAYKLQFGTSTDDSLIIQWTGEGVFSDQITMESVARAKTTYATDNLYIWDNFPVNDGQPDRLFLNPLDGRALNLHELLLGFTSNPMVQPYASMIALAGYADYTWNGPAYQPAVTMDRILDELAGDDAEVREALEVFVDLNQDWRPYRPSSQQAPALGADIAAFWAAHEAGTEAGKTALKERLATIVALPTTLAEMAEPGFYADSKPWIDAAADWARAMQQAIIALEEMDADKSAAAEAILASVDLRDSARDTPRVSMIVGDVVQPNVRVPKVGDGRFDTFLLAAYDVYEESLGGTAVASSTLGGTATTTMGQWSDNAASRMVDGNMETLWWSNVAPSIGSTVTVDLGSVQSIGGISVHQSDDDTTRGDMLYHAALEYSVDGTTWTAAGQFDDAVVMATSFAEPVQARYVRARATGVNPGDKWVKIREFQVLSPGGEVLTTVEGANAGAAFDLNVTTAVTGTAVAGDIVERTLSEPQTDATIRVLGGTGEVQAEVDGEWITVGEATAPWFEGHVRGEVTGVRLVLDAGQANVVELVVAEYAAPTNQAPAIAAIPAASGRVGTAVSIQVRATDPEGAALTYSATGLPAGVTINPTTGLISGSPTASGTFNPVITVTDASGASSTRTFAFTVAAAPVQDTTGPVITAVGSQTGTAGTALRIAVMASDQSTPLVYSATGLPVGVTIDPATGVISGTPTGQGAYRVTVKVTDAKGNASTTTFTLTVKPKQSVPGRPKFERTIPYTLPGTHNHNGRQWRTACEDYSQTERCRTEIWASVVERSGSTYSIKRGWAFNNLTYLPFMTRAQWANNPLGNDGEFTGTDGARWRTECDTELTGSDACRSFRWTTVYFAAPNPTGGYLFGQENKWVFNNIVMFGNYSR